ncbi:MAG: chemotaxis protein CheW [Deltaproteobacteria bacterium]|nr:chemotaxis protein CheW [Deltaproteobacteria bacterium]
MPRRASGAAIDWTSIYTRLDEVERKVKSVRAVAPERVHEILRRRALELSRTDVQGDSRRSTARHSMLVFSVVNGQYAVAAELASEILPLGRLTPIPLAPSYVAGVTSRRGQILMLLDLRRLLGLAALHAADLVKVIVIGQAPTEVGLLAENVEGVVEAADSDVAAPLLAGDYVRGIVGGKITLLDAKKLLQLGAATAYPQTR